jgi:TatA/E family protein of Tat protein translocase
MPQLGPLEILVILVVALLVFGPNRLPDIGRQVGRAMRELRSVQQTVRREINTALAEDATDATEPAPTLPPKLDGTPGNGAGDASGDQAAPGTAPDAQRGHPD